LHAHGYFFIFILLEDCSLDFISKLNLQFLNSIGAYDNDLNLKNMLSKNKGGEKHVKKPKIGKNDTHSVRMA
jgi:hypothetical protein